MWKKQAIENAAFWAKNGLALWAISAAFRRLGEMDLPASRGVKIARIGIVLLCWLVASIPDPKSGPLQAAAALLGLAALLWPNCVTRLASLITRSRETTLEPDGIAKPK